MYLQLTSYTSFINKDLTTDEMKAIEKNRMKQYKGKVTQENVIILGPMNYDECKNYGLVICDFDTVSFCETILMN